MTKGFTGKVGGYLTLATGFAEHFISTLNTFSGTESFQNTFSINYAKP
jgi:hypothetical protein